MLSKKWARLCSSVARKPCSQFGGRQSRSSGTVGLVFPGHRRFKSDSVGLYPEDEAINLLVEEWPLIRTSRAQKVLSEKIQSIRSEHQLELQSLRSDKDAELQSLRRDKDAELQSIRYDFGLTLKDKEICVMELQHQNRICVMELQHTKSLALRAKSLLNSRGILEFHLMEVHNERFPKKNFNAKQICESLKTEEPVESKPKAWRLQECYNQMANSNPNCSFFQKPMGDALYCMYRTLSQDIHGYPWSGESVLIVETLPHEMKVYLKCLAKKTFGLESREVSARLLNGL